MNIIISLCYSSSRDMPQLHCFPYVFLYRLSLQFPAFLSTTIAPLVCHQSTAYTTILGILHYGKRFICCRYNPFYRRSPCYDPYCRQCPCHSPSNYHCQCPCYHRRLSCFNVEPLPSHNLYRIILMSIQYSERFFFQREYKYGSSNNKTLSI